MFDKNYTGKHSGFSMIIAIIVILLVAWLAAKVLNVSANESKATGDRYLHYQAELLVDSATDYAVMRIGAYNTANQCLQDINITTNDAGGNTMFDITSTIYYSFEGAAPTGCPANNILAQNTGMSSMVLIDTNLTSRSTLNTETIQVHHRSWQKP